MITIDDADLLSRLHKESFCRQGYKWWSTDTFRGVMASPDSLAFLAFNTWKRPNIPIGFSLARVIGGECEILSIGVKPNAQRQGVGRAILEATNLYAYERGAKSTVLEVAKDNAAAISLYCSLGFKAVGNRQAYYVRNGNRVDALILRLRLI